MRSVQFDQRMWRSLALQLCIKGDGAQQRALTILQSTHTLKDYEILVKQIIELCEKGANQSAKDNRDSVGTAASFANGRYVAYMQVLDLIVNYKNEDKE